MRYKKIIIFIIILLWIAGSAAQIWRINSLYPNPEEKPAVKGESVLYKGLTLTAGDVEVYTWEELQEVYPDWQGGFFIQDEESTLEQYNYIIFNITLTNETEEKISFGKEGTDMWVMESGLVHNGSDYFAYMSLNPHIMGQFEPGDTETLKLPYSILREYKSIDELKSDGIKLVYSYYPTKNYILYQ
jgi:hypothetical protein